MPPFLRPFYFLGSLFAIWAVPYWLSPFDITHWFVFTTGLPMSPPFPKALWHAHEMVYGYIWAIIIGFLFTPAHTSLHAKTAASQLLRRRLWRWLIIRLLYLSPWVDVAFALEILLLTNLAQPSLKKLLQARIWRQGYILGLISLFIVIDLGCWLSWRIPLNTLSPLIFLDSALFVIASLISVMGGRMIPAFTANATASLRQWRWAWLDRIAIFFTLMCGLLHLCHAFIAIPGLIRFMVPLATALAHGLRWLGWRPWTSRHQPLLWILHLSYLWIIIGFALLAGAHMPHGTIPLSIALHAIAVGGISGMIMGMMTRTSMAYTGSPLRTGRAEWFIYLGIQAAAGSRAILPVALYAYLPILEPRYYTHCLWLSASFWISSLGIFCFAYWPQLSHPQKHY
ncbi:NnrS family protein [Parvibium lacunae]|uniref:NnrS family protein n=1 Tax=Parvibium lacunae TaxID=1888893 RepID=A0A368L711_9BURK|nr:NnrS family protein [Parvibium lacunae]RCS59416.1 NnrS family protein [Parvibium lacunae]